jgi:DNA-binding transcriptional LysR family regulator
MRDDLSDLFAFLTVAEKSSFRAASDELRVTPSAISQNVRQLEERLGLRLLARTTRSVALTEAGEHLYNGLRPAFADVRTTLESLNELRSRPTGTVRLNVSSIAESFLAEGTLAEFLAEYPDIKLDVAVDDSNSDIVQQGFDAGVRLGEVIDRDMVAVRASGDQRQIVVGAPRYFQKHGKPKHPRDLHRHACIGWRVYSTPAPYNWEFSENGRDFEVAIDARVNTNEMRLMLRLACDGVGLSIGLEETFRPYLDRGELVPVLEKFCPRFAGFFLYYPSRSQTPAKLRALIDFLKKRNHPGKRR